jgi:hypothetical protein
MFAASLSPAPLRPIRVVLDGVNLDAPIDAYTRGDRWNGFECPFFTREQAASLARLWRAAVHCSAEYYAARDEWVFYEPEDRDHPMRAVGQDEVDAEGRSLRVYCIGGWAWCWIEASS